MMAKRDFGFQLGQTVCTDHRTRDALAERYLQLLHNVPRGDACAWMAASAVIAAEAFEQGISVWHVSMHDARAYGMATSAGSGNQGAAGASLNLRRMMKL